MKYGRFVSCKGGSGRCGEGDWTSSAVFFEDDDDDDGLGVWEEEAGNGRTSLARKDRD